MSRRQMSHHSFVSPPHRLRQAVQEALRPRRGVWAGGLLAASLASPLPALGLELSALDGRNGFALNGAGVSVSGAGDVNGDGFDDLLIGAPGASPGGRESAGQSYVVFGHTGGFPASIDLSTLDGRTGFALNGIASYDFAGQSVSNAGDVNGDGIQDLLIGALNASPGGRLLAGQGYVVFGHTGGFPASIDLSALDGRTGFALNGIASYDRAGQSVSAAGDINGDGIDDLLIGAPGVNPGGRLLAGQGYVVFGHTGGFPARIELSALDGHTGFALNGAGVSVSGAGDVNGDGFDDLLIGAPGASPGGRLRAGQGYVVFGHTGGFPASIDLSTLDGRTGFALNGIARGNLAGSSVSGAGDVNGDGIDDLLIGATGADPGGRYNAGQSYVVFGHTGGFPARIELSALDGHTGFALNGIAARDGAGSSVSSAGDVNGDGVDDLLIGAQFAGPGGRIQAGQSYVVFGRTDGFPVQIELSALDGRTGFALNGIAARDYVGRSVSGAGDVNGDGIDDLLIGAPNADPGGRRAGQSYVVFGTRRVPVNDRVSFAPLRDTFRTTSNTAGCPAGSVGKFSFSSRLTNISTQVLSYIQVEVTRITGGNVLLTAQGRIGKGGTFDVLRAGGYTDGVLSPRERVDVPFKVCLKTGQKFSLRVNVLAEIVR